MVLTEEFSRISADTLRKVLEADTFNQSSERNMDEASMINSGSLTFLEIIYGKELAAYVLRRHDFLPRLINCLQTTPKVLEL